MNCIFGLLVSLAFLPISSASPLLIGLIILSRILDSKPCFYCYLVLAGILISTVSLDCSSSHSSNKHLNHLHQLKHSSDQSNSSRVVQVAKETDWDGDFWLDLVSMVFPDEAGSTGGNVVSSSSSSSSSSKSSSSSAPEPSPRCHVNFALMDWKRWLIYLDDRLVVGEEDCLDEAACANHKSEKFDPLDEGDNEGDNDDIDDDDGRDLTLYQKVSMTFNAWIRSASSSSMSQMSIRKD